MCRAGPGEHVGSGGTLLEVAPLPGDYRDDATLTTMANNALALNITVPDGVEASARKGNIRLTGTMSYYIG